MNRDELRNRLTFYQDLGVKQLYKRATPVAAAAPATTAAAPAPALIEPALPPLAPPGDTLALIRADVGDDCRRCRLCEQRNKIVFGVGNEQARLVFVGEGPGADEDAQGIPFVGRAGQLLTQMIENTASKEGIPIKRADVYICNVVKCRQPEIARPQPDEMEICGQFLFRQLEADPPACDLRARVDRREGSARHQRKA
jgi:DNA polymerase